MLAGFDRYMQIARCFRDEDLRADRQPEFTQIDLEMSFVDEEQIVMAMQEGFLKRVFKEVLDVDVQTPFLRMPWREAMDRFGSDKPDLRFGFELKDISDIVKGCGFGVFSSALAAGRLGAPASTWTAAPRTSPGRRSTSWPTSSRPTGPRAWPGPSLVDAGGDSSFYQKFLHRRGERRHPGAGRGRGRGPGAHRRRTPRTRWSLPPWAPCACECAKQLGILDPNDFKFLWVTEFPMFECVRGGGPVP